MKINKAEEELKIVQENNAKFYRFEKEGQIFKVTYSYFENYDPSIKPEPKK